MATFENDIEKKLGGFELQPSAHVWQGVEASLHEKKKRRFAIWWWMPVLGLLLLGFGWWTMMSNEKQDGKALADATTIGNKREILAKEQEKSRTEQIGETAKTGADNQEEKQIGNKVLAAKNNDEEKSSENNVTASLETKKKTANNVVRNNTRTEKKASTGIVVKKATISSTPKTTEVAETNATNKQQAITANKTTTVIDEQKRNTITVEETSSSKTTVAITDSLIKSDSNTLAKTSKTIVTADSSLAKDSSTKSIAKNKKKKNNWHFVAGGGLSLVQGNNFINKLFTGDEKSAAPSNFQTGSVGSGSTSGAGAGNANYSLPQTGFSFLIGAGHEWNLNKHWQLNAGLQYRYIQNKQQLSMMGISNFSGASALASQVSNQSHWLQLPVNISYTINPNSSTKFKLMAGGSMALPVSQKWLVTPAYGNYYYDQSRNSKTIANANAGIAMQMKTGYQFLLMAEQSLTSIHKNNSRNYYWQQYSLQVQLPFTKIFKPKP